MKQVLKARGDPERLRAGALDVYAASGYLLRASSAFVGGLSDYIEHRALLGDAKGSVIERKLDSAAAYYADAIDTFLSAVAALASEPGNRRSAGDRDDDPSAVCGEGATDCMNRVLTGSPALDRYRIILADARQNHDVLRHSVIDLRKHIKRTFGLTESLSS